MYTTSENIAKPLPRDDQVVEYRIEITWLKAEAPTSSLGPVMVGKHKPTVHISVWYYGGQILHRQNCGRMK